MQGNDFFFELIRNRIFLVIIGTEYQGAISLFF
jgi:hypothetical protein